MKNPKDTLLILSSSALSISSISTAATMPDMSLLSVQSSQYQEADLSASKSATGQNQKRYKIKANKFRLLTPVSENISIDVNYLAESLSGASPWFNSLGTQNKPITTMSGASINESRTEAGMSLNLYKDDFVHSIGFSSSLENDYSSQAFQYGMTMDTNKNNTTLNMGVGISSDRIFPNQSEPLHENTLQGIDTAKKRSQSFYAGISQVLNTRLLGRVNFSYTQLSGYLTDPYKLLDRRPDERTKITLSAGLRYLYKPWNAAIHADYQYYSDDWKLKSDTVTVKAYFNLPYNWQLVPGIRYYSQRGAEFYRAFLPENTAIDSAYYSEDYRLSYYGALSLQLDIYKAIGDYRLKFSVENYNSDAKYGQANAAFESPGLVDFTVLSIGLDYLF